MNHEKGRSNYRILAGAACSAAVLGLAACGGGDGGGGGEADSPTATPDSLTGTVAIDKDNANETVKSTIGGSASAISTSASTQSSANSYSAVSKISGNNGLVPMTLDEARKAMNKEAQGGYLGGVSYDQLCSNDGGTFTLTTTPPNDSDVLSQTDDAISLSYDNCEFLSGEVFDGSFTLTLKGGTFDGGSTNYDLLISYDGYSAETSAADIYSDGTLRIKSGTETGTWPTGHSLAGKVGGGQVVETEIRMGDDGRALVFKDLNSGESYRYETLAMFLQDADTSNGEFTGATPFYLAYHGTDGTDSGTLCSDNLGGCVKVSHSGTTAFEFTGTNEYPTAGVYKILGDAGSSLTLDADTNDPATANLTVVDTGGTTVVNGDERNWSDMADDSFASSLSN